MLRHTLLVGITLLLPTVLTAQRADSAALPVTTARTFNRGVLDTLPVDSLRTALGFLPGVVPGSRGDLYVRGGSPEGLVTYIDGVPVQPGVRSSGFGTSVGPLTPWATGLEQVRLISGPYGAAYGNGTAGLLDLLTRSGSDRWAGGLRYSTDELSGDAASFGVNRVEGSVGGPLGHHVAFFAGGFVHGQQSAASGLDGAAAPIFVPVGVDTTLAVPTQYGNPAADTTYVSVPNWAVYRGNCSTFAGSADPGIASNYGAPCKGVRIPLSASTSARYQLRLDASPAEGTTLWFSALGGRDQARLFNYDLVQDAQAMTGQVNDSRVWTLGARRVLSSVTTVEAALSLQRDQSENSPLDPSAEQDTRDPFGGFLLAPLGLRWNLSNFPVDDQLVTNYRDDIPNSRRSPYDLSNPSQYAQTDLWRTDPYGLPGYVESGPPNGRLSLYQETRVVGRVAATWHSASAGTLTFGLEGTRYSIADYTHVLTSQIFSDVWKEQPVAAAAYVTDRLTIADLTVDAGLRYQYFRTGAERPWLLDTVATSAGYNTYLEFPRTYTYGVGATSGGLPLLQYRPDQAHSALSPSLAIAARIDDRTSVHAGIARQVELPDFAMSFAGINTDLQETNTSQPFGADLGFLDGTVLEAGVIRVLGTGVTATVTGYHRRDLTRPVAELVTAFDPLAKSNTSYAQAAYVDGGTTNGAEIELSGRAGLLSGTVAYAYQHTSYAVPLFISAPDEGDRPHSLTTAATLALPRGWEEHTLLGRIFERTAVTVLARYASGARDYGCPATTFATPGAPACPDPHLMTFIEPARLPSIKTVDLRLSRGIDVGGRSLSIFLDAHNLFNFKNYTAALGPTATTSSPTDEIDQLVDDSVSFAAEANANGLYNGATGAINLTFGGAADPRTGCGAWVTIGGTPASPNCVALIRAEQRYGNGDGIFTLAEQRNASRAQYLLSRGLAAMTDLPRRIRLGVELAL